MLVKQKGEQPVVSDTIFNDVSFYKTRQGFQLPETSLKLRYDVKRKNTIWLIVLTVLTIAVNVYILTTQTVESDIPLWVIVCCPLIALPIVFLSIWFARKITLRKKFSTPCLFFLVQARLLLLL